MSFWFKTTQTGEFSGAIALFNPHSVNNGVWVGDPTHFDLTSADNVNIVDNSSAGPSTGAWHHYLASGNSQTGESKIFIDGVDVSDILTNNSPFSTALNGTAFYIANDTFGDFYVGDLADLWVAPNVSLLSGGTITAPTIAKFYDAGSPVYLGANGELPTSTSPAGFWSGNAAAWTGGNLGTGGAAVWTGVLTDASTHP